MNGKGIRPKRSFRAYDAAWAVVEDAKRHYDALHGESVFEDFLVRASRNLRHSCRRELRRRGMPLPEEIDAQRAAEQQQQEREQPGPPRPADPTIET